MPTSLPTTSLPPRLRDRPGLPTPAPVLHADRIDWLANRLERLIPGAAPAPLPPQLEQFTGFLWPAAIDYGAPVPRAFLHGFRGSASLAGAEAWIVRDGLIPLLWFFRTHPRPERGAGRLLVPESMAPYVPEAWRRHTESFRLTDGPCSVAPADAPPRRRLLITGIAMDTYCSLEHLARTLPRLTELARREGVTEFNAFLPARMDGYGNEHRHEYLGEFYGRLATTLPGLRYLRWTEFDSTESWSDSFVVDLNEELLLADSYLVHHALARGARPLERAEPDAERDECARIPLSPHHSLSCSRLAPRPAGTRDMDRAFARAFAAQHSSEASRRFPWPEWHLAAARNGRRR